MSIGVVQTQKYTLTLYFVSLSLFLLHLCCCASIVYSKKVGFFHFTPIITWPSGFSWMSRFPIPYINNVCLASNLKTAGEQQAPSTKH
jgi:hypothetical protein